MEKTQKVLVLIDADSLVYSSSKEGLQESIENIDDKIKNIFEQTGADFYAMFISLGTYFRHRVDPAYKAQRKAYPTQLLWTRTLKNYLIEKYGAIASKDVEADDLVAYFYNKKMFYNGEQEDIDISFEQSIYATDPLKIVVASPDKDLLQSLWGSHYNYTYRLEDRDNPNSLIKGWWVETSESQADEYLRMQVICGDAGDNVGGLRGRGAAYWKKITVHNILSWGDLLQEYITHHKDVATGVYEFQKNFRLLKLLDSDSDFFREVGYIPEFAYHKVIVNLEEIPIETNPVF